MITIADSYYLALYFILCSLSIFSGIGILKLLGLASDGKKALLFSPLLAQILITLILNISLQLKVPINASYHFIWSVFVALGIYGFFQNRRYKMVGNNIWWIAGWMILPLLIMAGPYWYGSATKFGDILPDGWNYIAFGQYLWKYVGVGGGLSPLYQQASTLNSSRFTSSAFLALLSSLISQHDTSAGSGIYLGWVLFVFTGACGFFIAEKSLSDRKKVFYVVLVIFSGWIWNILWATNYDNLLALAYAPALIEISIKAEYLSKGWAAITGLAIASVSFAYLELGVAILGVFFIILLICFIQTDAIGRKKLLVFILIAGTISLVILLPFSKWFFTFVIIQIHAMSGLRPGTELFEGLLQWRCMPSGLWAMGCEQSQQAQWLYVGGEIVTQSWLPLKNAISLILSVFMIVGVFRLFQKNKWHEIILLFAVAPVIGYMIFVQNYSYGAYKFILLLWWLVPYLVLAGIEHITKTASNSSKTVSALLYLPLFFLLFNTAFRVAYTVITKPAFLQSDYAQIYDIPIIVQGNPILVNVDNWLSSEWAIYYLREQDSFLNLKRAYMMTNSNVLDQSKAIDPKKMHYVLLDGDPEYYSLGEMVWQGKPYSIWKLPPDWIFPSDIQNDYGIENLDGKTSFWLGEDKAAFSFTSSFDGMAVMIGEFATGPSIASGQSVTIEIWNDFGFQEQVEFDANKRLLFHIPVKVGVNQLYLRSLTTPTIRSLPNGDPRILLASVRGINLHKDSGDWVLLADIKSPNGIDYIDNLPLYWIGDKPTRIVLFASHDGWVNIAGNFNPGPSILNSFEQKLLIQTNTGFIAEANISRDSQILIPVRQGYNEVILQGLDKSAITKLPGGDKRILLISLSNLKFAYQSNQP